MLCTCKERSVWPRRSRFLSVEDFAELCDLKCKKNPLKLGEQFRKCTVSRTCMIFCASLVNFDGIWRFYQLYTAYCFLWITEQWPVVTRPSNVNIPPLFSILWTLHVIVINEEEHPSHHLCRHKFKRNIENIVTLLHQTLVLRICLNLSHPQLRWLDIPSIKHQILKWHLGCYHLNSHPRLCHRQLNFLSPHPHQLYYHNQPRSQIMTFNALHPLLGAWWPQKSRIWLEKL